MTNWQINNIELIPENGIYITKEIPFKPSIKNDSASVWLGTECLVSNIQTQPSKITFRGIFTTETAARSLMKYHAQNYNWNEDVDDIYLAYGLSKRWKIKSMEVSVTYDWQNYPFDIEIVVADIIPEGYIENTLTGTITTSGTRVSGIYNQGDRDTNFNTISVTGIYASGSNLTSPQIQQYLIGYYLDVADVLLDSATFYFYNTNYAKHVYIDYMLNSDKFTRNKYSSTGVTFSSDRLVFANSASLVYKFQLIHPLVSDPILKLSISGLTGTPALEVSPDGTNWWAVEKSLVNGTLVKYTLTKLAGYSTFYWRITTNASSSMNLLGMNFESWHNYSGYLPYPYIRANNVEEMLDFTFSAGSLEYYVAYRDKWNF